MADSTVEVVVIGGGQAGLGVSYFLKDRGIDHIIIERGKIGESWRSQRWDSFMLNTPYRMSLLPGQSYRGDHPEGFHSLQEYISSLESYVSEFDLPVRENSKVISVDKVEGKGGYRVTTTSDAGIKCYYCRQVVVASGCMNERKIPSVSSTISPEILQLHTSDYRNPAQLPGGAVLVVGSAQSGCQIAEDLIADGRKVFLSTGMVPRVPRRYRGKDILTWLSIMNYFDLPTEQVTNPQVLTMNQPLISGVGFAGHTMSYQSLAACGSVILGKLESAEGKKIHFQQNAATHVRFADASSIQAKEMTDAFIVQAGLNAPVDDGDPADLPDPGASCVSDITNLDLSEHGITTVIWTTGFGADYSWLKMPVINNTGYPIHSKGLTTEKGLYFLGLPWLRRRKSGFIFGICEDAEYLADKIIHHPDRNRNIA